jgi:hypothetical protein
MLKGRLRAVSSERGAGESRRRRPDEPFYIAPVPAETMIRAEQRYRNRRARARRQKRPKEPLYGLRAWSQIVMGMWTYGVTLAVAIIAGQSPFIQSTLGEIASVMLSILGLLIFCGFVLIWWRWKFHLLGVFLATVASFFCYMFATGLGAIR